MEWYVGPRILHGRPSPACLQERDFFAVRTRACFHNFYPPPIEVYPYFFLYFIATVANHTTKSVLEILLHRCQSHLPTFLPYTPPDTLHSLPFLRLHDLEEVATLSFHTSPLTPLHTAASIGSFFPLSPRSSDAFPSHDRHSSRFRRRRLLGFHEHRSAIPDGVGVVRRGRPLRPASSGCRHPPSFWLLRHLFSAKTSSRLFATRKTDATSSSMPSGCSAFSSPSFSRSETPTPRRRRSPLRRARFS